jgi:hypothetical protein
MNVEQDQQWITGEEFARERRRLIEEGVPREAPEFRALYNRIGARDDSLYERYGKPYLESHYGKWIAISMNGDVLIDDTLGKVLVRSRKQFGPGNASIRKLAEFPGLDLSR